MKTAFLNSGRWVFIALLCLPSLNASAGHILGTDIAYVYAGQNAYLVNVRWFRDCQGLQGSQQISICYSSVNAGISNTVSLQAIPGFTYLPPFPYWPPMQTTCTGGSATGIELLIYQGLIILPSAQTDWIISYSTFPQNIGIGQNFMYVSTQIDNLNYPTNSSPYFTNYPTFIYCVNQPAWDNFASADADGDSLSYHLIPVLDNTIGCPPAPFLNPVPAFPPLQSSAPVIMDSTNGSLTFTPSMVGSSMVSARVDEFRNGILINSSTIEHVFYIVTGCTITGLTEQNFTGLSLTPNPASDMLKLEMQHDEPLIAIEVIDLSGKTSNIFYSKSAEGIYELDINILSKGIYTLRVITDFSTSTQQFVKF